ncbi:MAG: hypothetical protein K0R13_3374, partial [Propionibacteriaceae bacterium]|nr:hypothetical protein [Propionibacteriaceae bacterium]
ELVLLRLAPDKVCGNGRESGQRGLVVWMRDLLGGSDDEKGFREDARV